jgi:hypothetical protein
MMLARTLANFIYRKVRGEQQGDETEQTTSFGRGAGKTQEKTPPANENPSFKY